MLKSNLIIAESIRLMIANIAIYNNYLTYLTKYIIYFRILCYYHVIH